MNMCSLLVTTTSALQTRLPICTLLLLAGLKVAALGLLEIDHVPDGVQVLRNGFMSAAYYEAESQSSDLRQP